MDDQILALISALNTCKHELAEVYANPQGVHFNSEAQDSHIARLVTIKAVRIAHDGSYRLDSRLKKFFDWTLNRRSIFGNSTHYSDILSNLETAVTGYTEALVRADMTELSEKLGAVFELCDDFASGMTEDIEQFRFVIETQRGFSGTSIEEKIVYNENRLKRAKELLNNVSRVRDLGFVGEVEHSQDLSGVLQKELFNRHEAIQTRLYEVHSALSATLFELRTVNSIALRIIGLDNYLTKHPDIMVPAWETMDEPPEWAMVFPGLRVNAYPGPGVETYALELMRMVAGVSDNMPEAPRARRSNEALQVAPPPDKEIPLSAFLTSLYQFSDAAADGARVGAVAWLEANTCLFQYGPTVWLQMLSNELANGTLDIPDNLTVTRMSQIVDDECRLSDIVISQEKREAVNG